MCETIPEGSSSRSDKPAGEKAILPDQRREATPVAVKKDVRHDDQVERGWEPPWQTGIGILHGEKVEWSDDAAAITPPLRDVDHQGADVAAVVPRLWIFLGQTGEQKTRIA